MRDWIKRILGREGQENSERTQAELNQIERQVRLQQLRVEHIRRERKLYDKRIAE